VENDRERHQIQSSNHMTNTHHHNKCFKEVLKYVHLSVLLCVLGFINAIMKRRPEYGHARLGLRQHTHGPPTVCSQPSDALHTDTKMAKTV